MIKWVGLALVSCLIINILQAQARFAITDYYANKARDTLVFETSVGRAFSSQAFIYSEVNFRNQTVLKRTESTQGFRFEKLNSNGLSILGFQTPDGQELQLEKPLLFLPATVQERQVQRDTTHYTILKNGVMQGTGVLLIETEVEGFMSAETPLRNFVNCLIINTKIIQKVANGRQSISEWKEWYAKGIGLVNAIVRTYQLEATGKASPLHITMYQLEKAQLGGKPLDGKRGKMKE